MRRVTAALAAAAIMLGGAFALPRATGAHSLLQSSDPAAGSTVPVAPAVVVLIFGEAPDPALSVVKVLDTSGQEVASGPAVGVAGHPEQLEVPLGTLPDGVYTVAWRTVSTVDGHTTAGSFAFGVGVPVADAEQGAGQPTSPNGSVGDTLARFLMYLGLLGLLGAAFVGVAIHPRGFGTLGRFAIGAWITLVAGTSGVIAFQAIDAGTDIGSMLQSSLGLGMISRAVAAVVMGIAVAISLLVANARWRRIACGVLAATAAGGMLIDVVNGHPAAGAQPLLAIGLQWVHIVASGLWMGGLAALLVSVRGQLDVEKARAVRRFSLWAGFALAAIAATGLLRAIGEVGTLGALVDTDYGRLVVVKSGGLGVLALLGTFNHFVSVPAAVRSLRPLRLVGRAEVTIGAGVLLATGLLVNLAPPASVAATPATQPALTASGSDFGTTVRVQMTVTPGSAGINDFEVTVADYDTGEPLADATGVTLRFKPSLVTGVGGSTLRLDANGPGRFSASGGNLSLDGIWNVTAVVAGASGSVEVPLPVATVITGQAIDANAIPDAPTIYTAHLAAGVTLQVYLDPGTAGANELHATFFDSAGNELPVQTASILVTPAGQPGVISVPRQLEPGHFVLDLSISADGIGADVVGISPDGPLIHAHVDIPLLP
jgi:copper transport protein